MYVRGSLSAAKLSRYVLSTQQVPHRGHSTGGHFTFAAFVPVLPGGAGWRAKSQSGAGKGGPGLALSH